jgi:hypothetical protein
MRADRRTGATPETAPPPSPFLPPAFEVPRKLETAALPLRMLSVNVEQAALRAVPDSPGASLSTLHESVKAVGEPSLSGLDPAALAQDLAAVGLELQEDLTNADVVQRHDAAGVTGLRPASRSRTARARVVPRQA